MNRKALTGIVIMAILAVAAWGEPIIISVEEISAAYADPGLFALQPESWLN